MKQRCLIYCCKATKKSDYLIKNWQDKYVLVSKYLTNTKQALNGKIVCECEVDTEEIFYNYVGDVLEDFWGMQLHTRTLKEQEILDHSKIFWGDLRKYLLKDDFDCIKGGEVGYALHLSNVKERVMGLSKCYTRQCHYGKCSTCYYGQNDIHCSTIDTPITKAPQNMMWVWIKENGKWVKYLLISVRPQWLCLELNEEKDIEVRRKVLKGMCD